MKEIRCKNCWWFRVNTKKEVKKGQCLMYGFFLEPNSTICCDYSMGDMDG